MFQIDPTRTISAGKVNLGAFRTYPKVQSLIVYIIYHVMFISYHMSYKYIFILYVTFSNSLIIHEAKTKENHKCDVFGNMIKHLHKLAFIFS